MMALTAQDYQWMARALQLARQGLYTTTPNPRVGCVIVKNNQMIGEGAHLKAGEPHAEVFALRQASANAQGADIYVTLEPCSHTGKTPPCVDAVIAAQPKRVIIAVQDPNPLVAGSGVVKLRAHGIEVLEGALAQEAQALNAGFSKRMTQGMPWVRSKIAASLDGKTALNNGESQWITGEAARADVQRWRALSCAILTGIGTVLADNPRLNVRDLAIGRQPLRVVVDSQLKIPLDCALLQQQNVLVVYAIKNENTDLKTVKLQEIGINCIYLPNKNQQVDLSALLKYLADLHINEVLVEAGAQLNGALLQAQLVDEWLIYQAPILLGHRAQGMFDLSELQSMQAKIALKILETRQVGVDTLLRLSLRP